MTLVIFFRFGSLCKNGFFQNRQWNPFWIDFFPGIAEEEEASLWCHIFNRRLCFPDSWKNGNAIEGAGWKIRWRNQFMTLSPWSESDCSQTAKATSWKTLLLLRSLSHETSWNDDAFQQLQTQAQSIDLTLLLHRQTSQCIEIGFQSISRRFYSGTAEIQRSHVIHRIRFISTFFQILGRGRRHHHH